MEPVDLIALEKTSRGERNAHLARTSVLPACSRNFSIENGPTLQAICLAPAHTVPDALAEALNLARDSKHHFIDDHIPLQFTLKSYATAGNGRHGGSFAVGVYVKSIDFDPVLAQAHWSLFGPKPDLSNAGEWFSDGTILICGWYHSLGKNSEVLGECVIAYNPRRGTGYFGEVAELQKLPTNGLIKDIEVLWRVVRERYLSGFIESSAPDGVTRWCRVVGGDGSHVECDAEKKADEAWKYNGRKEPIRLSLVGTALKKDGGCELIGDAFLCSDGTVLHTYYFSRAFHGVRFADSALWKDGYYSNRFYLPESPMVPKHITDSFAGEMPTWFYKEDEVRKAKTRQIT